MSTDDDTDDDDNSRPTSPPARYSTPFAPDAVIAGKRALEADMRLPDGMLSAMPTAGGGEDDQSRPTERVAQSPRPAEDVGAGAEEGRSTEDEGEGGERQGQGSQEDGAVLMVEAECLPGEPGKEARGEVRLSLPCLRRCVPADITRLSSLSRRPKSPRPRQARTTAHQRHRRPPWAVALRFGVHTRHPSWTAQLRSRSASALPRPLLRRRRTRRLQARALPCQRHRVARPLQSTLRLSGLARVCRPT